MDKYYLNKEDAIVLVVDIQEKLLPSISGKDKLMNKAKIVISGAQILNVPIFATEQYPKGLGKTVDELDTLLEGHSKFSKTSFTGCTDEVMAYLEGTKKKQVIVIGAETHVCVYQTTRDLLSRGYDVFIASDAVGSRTEENKQNGIGMMRDMGAVISNTESLLFDLLKVSGTPEFKAISKLIK